MARQAIGIGSSAGDGTGDTVRAAFDKVNDNSLEIYDSPSELSPALTIGSGNSSAAVDLDSGTVVGVTLNVNWTASFSRSSGLESGRAHSLTLIITQGTGGSRTITWPSSVKWDGGTAPTLSTAVGAVDVVTLITRNQGTTWYAFLAGKGMA